MGPTRSRCFAALSMLGLLGVWSAPAAADETLCPMTSLEAGPLTEARLVVLGDVVGARETRGQMVLRIDVARTFRGEPVEQVLVFVGDTASRRGRGPGFDPEERGRHVFFLDAEEGAIAWRWLTSFAVDGVVGGEKVEVLAEEARLAGLPPGAERRALVVDHLLGLLEAEGLWSRVHAARELDHVTRVRPDAFDPEAAERLRAAARSGNTPEVRRWLEEASARLPTRAALAGEPARRPSPTTLPVRAAGTSDEERIEALVAWLRIGGTPAAVTLVARLSAETAPVRLALVDWLADRGAREVRTGIRDGYPREDDPAAARAIVRAVGLLGDAEDVPWLTARLQNGGVRREALFALARIRTVAALRALREAPDRLAARGDPMGDTRPLVSYLLGRAFEEAELEAGRLVGPDRWR